MFLNYHHLKYFQAIAHEGGLTRAAARLRVAQSALSVQLRQLEETLGHDLFVRKNRKLELTEVGRVTLRYADTIFKTGEELLDTLQHRPHKERQILKVGAVATLSRNFQWEFLKPLRQKRSIELVVRSGSLRELAMQLRNHSIDVMLSNQPLKRDTESEYQSHLLAEQPVSLVASPAAGQRPFRFPDDFQTTPVLLPSLESDVRVAFDMVLSQAGVSPLIAGEVDDMAMLRVLTLKTKSAAILPKVVVQDELRMGVLVERYRFRDIRESFYATAPTRTFPNLLVDDLIERARQKR